MRIGSEPEGRVPQGVSASDGEDFDFLTWGVGAFVQGLSSTILNFQITLDAFY